jgi:hypothetical protein
MIDAAMAAAALLAPLERGPLADNTMFAEWKTLRNRISKRADRRNEMAHFAMHMDASKKPGHRFYLAPNMINVNALIRHAGKPPTRNICMLIAQGNSFQKLGKDLQNFYSKWAGQEAWPFAASL